MKKSASLAVYYFSIVFIFILSFFYYPRWQKEGTQSDIAWDVSGYYWYLPATFIYKDVKHLAFSDSILKKYNPTPNLQQAFPYPNGNYVMKYSSGLALQFLPFFLIADVLASPLGYERDGFSPPYDLALQIGGVLFAFLGLWFFRKTLLLYFEDNVVAIVMLVYILCTNYLNYAAIDSTLTHNWLFTWYCILIYYSHRFYQQPSFKKSIIIGSAVGICALTRPTDIISLIIPLSWGMSSLSSESLKQRFAFIIKYLPKYLLAIFICTSIGSIQLFYWKYVTNHWLVYSYQDQTFSWLNPHFSEYLFSFQSGWLIYTPVMIFAFIGFPALIKRKLNVVPVLVFGLLNLYIVASWDIWWYGGRAMVQSYPILAFPLAAFIQQINTRKYLSYVVYTIFFVLGYYNLWWTYQAHTGGLLVEGITGPYLKKVIGRYNVTPDAVKLLDTDEEFTGERKNVKLVYQNNFVTDTIRRNLPAINGKNSLYLNKDVQFSEIYKMSFQKDNASWVRAKAVFHCTKREGNVWQMTQFIVRFKYNDETVKKRMIRVQRFLNDGDTKMIYFDLKIPEKEVNKMEILFWNPDGVNSLQIDDLQLESFN